MPHGVYLVEDHPVVREAFTDLIGRADDLALRGSAGSAEVALTDVAGLDVEVAVVDVSLGQGGGEMNGLDFAERLPAVCPTVRVLLVSGHDEAVYAERALRAGARGYLMKHEAGPHLLAAIREVIGGGLVLSDRMRGRLPSSLTGSAPAAGRDTRPHS